MCSVQGSPVPLRAPGPERLPHLHPRVLGRGRHYQLQVPPDRRTYAQTPGPQLQEGIPEKRQGMWLAGLTRGSGSRPLLVQPLK